MLNVDFDELVKQICKAKDISEAEVLKKVKEKKDTLKDLVSDEGAAYIVASELGVNILSDMPRKKLKIKDAMVGMRGVNLTGKVMQVFEIKEFTTKDKKSGKVAAFILADETGKARVALWNDQAELIKNISPNQVVRISDAYVKENKFSGKEFHISARGGVEEIKGEVIEVVSEGETSQRNINEAAPNELVQGCGILVQAYRPSFYSVCKECGSSLSDGKCNAHPDAEKRKEMVLSFMIDNGDKCLRCVSFKNTAEKIAKLSAADAEKIIIDKNEAALQEYIDNLLLGEQIRISGRMKYNQSFNRNEILVNNCEEVDCAKLISEFEKK